MMQLPWWGWTLLSVGGFAGTGLISARLAAARVPPTTINVYLFAVGLVAFVLYALLTKPDFRLPPSQCWWLLPLAGTLFASNYSVVTAYQAAPNVGFVKAIGVAELVLVALVVAALALGPGPARGLALVEAGRHWAVRRGCRPRGPGRQDVVAASSRWHSQPGARQFRTAHPSSASPSAPAVGLQVVAPASATSGSPFDVMVIAADSVCSTDMNYTGTILFTTSDMDLGVVLPPDYAFQASDAGMVTFPGEVTLITVGNQTLTAADTVSGITVWRPRRARRTKVRRAGPSFSRNPRPAWRTSARNGAL
jgi:hypothetical protein